MRNLFSRIILLIAVLWGIPNAQAQTQAQAQAQNNAPATNEAQDDSSDAVDESFGDIARLGQQISLAQRKMQAVTLQNSLNALEAQQATGDFNFKVLRVEGFNNTLYAVLVDDKGVVYQVGPGDLVNDQYRVSLLRPSSVNLVDINTKKTFPVPFVLGGASAPQPDVTIVQSNVTPVSAPAAALASK